ncbi:MAG: pantoate--beta-alanine ligase [Planctomycetaceae bacterium]
MDHWARPQASTTVVVGESALRTAIAAAKADGRRVGLVPTMGALHAGHLSLIRAARENCDFLTVSIFVNPAQFGPHEDLSRYPRPIESDLSACEEAGADLVFHPKRETMYPDGFATWVTVEGLGDRLEGAFRPGHFRGVATVVMKLLHLVQPDVSYFGRKDYQQQLIVRRMCADLGVPGEIVTCPTVRDEDGLAVSSRNRYLNAGERRSALALYQSLQLAKRRLQGGETDLTAIRGAMRARLESAPDVRVDYATIADPRTLEELTTPQSEMIALVAAHVGNTRLIDNLPISN